MRELVEDHRLRLRSGFAGELRAEMDQAHQWQVVALLAHVGGVDPALDVLLFVVDDSRGRHIRTGGGEDVAKRGDRLAEKGLGGAELRRLLIAVDRELVVLDAVIVEAGAAADAREHRDAQQEREKTRHYSSTLSSE